jgi:ferritin-like metal-binding protein YciE
MTLETLRSLYLHELQDLHSAESQLVKALPKLAKAANSPELKSAFTKHLAETREHVRRLEQILNGLGEEAGGHKCKGMAGLIKEGQDLVKSGQNGAEAAVLDSALITAAQKVEHYEIAGYGSARTYAQMLREDSAADVLQQTLNEEGQTDETLTEIAQATLSVAAQARRMNDIAMHGDARPGGVAMEAHNGARQQTMAAADEEDVDTYKGATEELDNDTPRNWPDESGGLGARSQPEREQENNPPSGQQQ